MRNTLGDLNNHLFAQLERLSDEDLVGEKLTKEIERAKSVTSVANQIISNGALVLQAQKFFNNPERLDLDAEKPKMLEG